ncbi:MAG: MFS transporter [Anaerolineae bacterium]
MSSSSVTIPTDSFYYAKRWVGLVFIGISVIVLSLDNTILNVALPSIARDLSASNTDLQWIIDGYVLVFAALLLTMGTLGDRIGRKRALQLGLVLFGVGSTAAALSQNTGILTFARMFLGIAGALMLPATLSIVSATFQPHERPQAIATWASLYGLGVGIGPVLGGFLIQNFSWHAVFFINIPVIAVALIGGQIYLGETKEPNAPPPDIIGSLLSIAGLFALIYGIIEAGVVGWTESNVILALIAAAVLIAVFAIWESRTPYPMLPLGFFRNPAFTGANITLTLVAFSLFGAVFFTPQFLQSILGYPAFTAGLLLLPLAITLTFMTSRSAWVSQYLGTKRTVALGVGLVGVAFLYMALVYRVDTVYFPTVFIAQLVQATGMGLAFSPATNAIMSSIPVAKAGVGSAMNDTTRQLGGALGVAILGTIATSVYLSGVAPLQSALSPEAFKAVSAGMQTAINPHTLALIDPNLQQTVIDTAQQAFMAGMNRAFLLGAAAMFASALFALAVLPDVVKSSRIRRVVNQEGEVQLEAVTPDPVPSAGQD